MNATQSGTSITRAGVRRANFNETGVARQGWVHPAGGGHRRSNDEERRLGRPRSTGDRTGLMTRRVCVGATIAPDRNVIETDYRSMPNASVNGRRKRDALWIGNRNGVTETILILLQNRRYGYAAWKTSAWHARTSYDR